MASLKSAWLAAGKATGGLYEDADEEGEEGVLRDGDMVITERSVPSAVFGDLAEQVKGGEKDDRDGAEPAKIVGALERFKSRS